MQQSHTHVCTHTHTHTRMHAHKHLPTKVTPYSANAYMLDRLTFDSVLCMFVCVGCRLSTYVCACAQQQSTGVTHTCARTHPNKCTHTSVRTQVLRKSNARKCTHTRTHVYFYAWLCTYDVTARLECTAHMCGVHTLKVRCAHVLWQCTLTVLRKSALSAVTTQTKEL